MRRVIAAAVLAASWAVLTDPSSIQGFAPGHRALQPQTAERHLEAARKALDHASALASADERPAVDKLRSDFAALALAFTHVPAQANTDNLPQNAGAPHRVGTAGAVPDAPDVVTRPAPVEPTETGQGVPPKTSGTTPQPATSDKRLAEWQLKYAAVDADLKALKVADMPRAFRSGIERFRSQVQLFYSAALGRADQ